MELLNSLLFVGLRRMYLLVDITEGRVCKEICAISKSTSTPLCIRMEQPMVSVGTPKRPSREKCCLRTTVAGFSTISWETPREG